MIEGYKFNKSNVDYNNLEKYIDGIIDALKVPSYISGIPAKNKLDFLRIAESLKSDITEIQRLYLTDTEFKCMSLYKLHNKSANNLISANMEKIEEQLQLLYDRIKNNIAKLGAAPSSLGIKEDKTTGEIEIKTKEELLGLKQKGIDYGFVSELYGGKFAQVNRELLDDMYHICEGRTKEECLKIYSNSNERLEANKDKIRKDFIQDCEESFGRSFDTKGTVRDNPDSMYILKRLAEINEEKFCLGLEFPYDLYENASRQELKMIEKYMKSIKKKQEALAKIEKRTMALIDTRIKKVDIKMAIEYLNNDSNIPQKARQKLLKTLNAQLRWEKWKEALIQKQIEQKRRRGKIAQYDKSRYELYSDMAKTQEDYYSGSLEGGEKRQNCKKKILSFWKHTIEKEVSPKKQEQLLLAEGVQEKKVSARDKFVSDINRATRLIIPTAVEPKDTIAEIQPTNDGVEPGDN